MGGAGSSRWHAQRKKDTVEDSRVLSIVRWMQEQVLHPGIRSSGRWKWTHAQTGEPVASIGYALDTTDMTRPWVKLAYTFPHTQERVGYHVLLQTTVPYFGGLRWWFLCPLAVRSRACQRRVAHLYLPPGSRYFGCRHCHDLTYESCQESHKFDRALAGVAQAVGADLTGAEVARLLQQRWKQP
jgi:hypothetical protein